MKDFKAVRLVGSTIGLALQGVDGVGFGGVGCKAEDDGGGVVVARDFDAGDRFVNGVVAGLGDGEEVLGGEAAAQEEGAQCCEQAEGGASHEELLC